MESLNQPSPTKPFSRRAQLEQILHQLSHQQLLDFVLETALHDQDLRDTVLIHFTHLLGSGASEEANYRQKLHGMIDHYQNSEGYINVEAAQSLADAIEALLNSAGKATTPAPTSLDMGMAVITILPRLGERMDDSEGHIYRLMRIACVVIWESFSVLPATAQEAVFQRLLHEYANPVYLDLDLDSFLLALLKDLAKARRDWQRACLKQQETLLNAARHDKWRRNYLLDQLNDLLQTWHKPSDTKKPA